MLTRRSFVASLTALVALPRLPFWRAPVPIHRPVPALAVTGLGPGGYSYKVTYVHAHGETPMPVKASAAQVSHHEQRVYRVNPDGRLVFLANGIDDGRGL